MALLLTAPFTAESESLNTTSHSIARYISATPAEQHITHATWYAGKCVGRRMAGGKRYEKNAVFVATHQLYPFGTRLKVTNLFNHRSVVVSVEDREPYHPGRTLDLSYAAAKQLDMLSAGVVLVSYSQVMSPYPQAQGDPAQ